MSLCFPCAAYKLRHRWDLALLANQNGRHFYKTHLATLSQLCSRHFMVCTFIPIKQPKSSRNKRTVKTESSTAPRKTWLLWRRISGRCLATKNNWFKRTNPDQQEYAFLAVAKQQKQIMQTVWINQSRVYEIT